VVNRWYPFGCRRFFVARLSYELYPSNYRDRGILLGCPLDSAWHGADLRYRYTRYRRIDRRPAYRLGGFWSYQRCGAANREFLVAPDHVSDVGVVHPGDQCCDAVIDRLGHLLSSRPCDHRQFLLDHHSGGPDYRGGRNDREPVDLHRGTNALTH